MLLSGMYGRNFPTYIGGFSAESQLPQSLTPSPALPLAGAIASEAGENRAFLKLHSLK
ncbi:MAG: hypothetical protein HC890_01200 [Chloroflexaceae bacterium]|nr:hypothetical protein [Chloroflexaceae bacterium]